MKTRSARRTWLRQRHQTRDRWRRRRDLPCGPALPSGRARSGERPWNWPATSHRRPLAWAGPPCLGQRQRWTAGISWWGSADCDVLEGIGEREVLRSLEGFGEANSGHGWRRNIKVSWTLSGTEGGPRLQLVLSGSVVSRKDLAHQDLGTGRKACLDRLAGVAVEEDNAGTLSDVV